eukprot:TRINITY_DN460_c0_g2_i1.p1 TRINITY_DN460_c0_g2~~TRINITY_DN460_c0_g2_i1.p1  ORF type:complete len:483 (+),score=158.18 TRINITY_DN460_c0_g2_i1:204-1652(+)
MADPYSHSAVRRSSSKANTRTLDPLTLSGKTQKSPEASPMKDRTRQKSTKSKTSDTLPLIDSVVLSGNEVKRIQSLAQTHPNSSDGHNRATGDELRSQSMMEAKARKERLQKYDEERRSHHTLSESEQRELDRANYIRRQAMELMTEQKDDVKAMNSIAQYAKCATIRDVQIEEKKSIMQERVGEERRLEAMMELERIKAIQMYEEREKKKVAERLRGADVIKKQIEDRERDRIAQQEIREQELLALQAQKERLAEEEREENRRKALVQKSMMTEITKSNAEQILRKHMQVEREKEEELRIAQYLAEKTEREQQFAEEQERKRAEKEREVSRMRSLQEKKKDEVEEKDALRAKRAMEARERDWRKQELEKAEIKSKQNAELAVARDLQKKERELKMATIAQEERAEFEKNVSLALRQMEEESKREQIEHQRKMKFSEDIRDQIKGKEEVKKRDLQEFFDEGRRLRSLQQEELARLEVCEQAI